MSLIKTICHVLVSPINSLSVMLVKMPRAINFLIQS
uniref:Uncharacterized protein n=1 Tax=Arundo donax TaxID=35708 RepID=A0A0A9BXS0_ARUDO